MQEFHCRQEDDQRKKHTLCVCPQSHVIEAHSGVRVGLHFLNQSPIENNNNNINNNNNNNDDDDDDDHDDNDDDVDGDGDGGGDSDDDDDDDDYKL